MKDDVGEVWDLVVAYLKQETVDPIKALGRYVAFGIVGSVSVVLGVGVVVLGLLRLLQGETGSAFQGHLSWLPYLVCAATTVVVAGAAVGTIMRTRKTGDRGAATADGRSNGRSTEGRRPS